MNSTRHPKAITPRPRRVSASRGGRRRIGGRPPLSALVLTVAVATGACAAEADRPAKPSAAPGARGAALQAQVDRLESRMPPPELGSQMIELQIRHDRLWWAGAAGNWNLAYYMVGELGEALRGIEKSNGEAAELQPLKLSDVMPSMMNPAIRHVQQALARHNKTAFTKAYDDLSAACTGCHTVAGVGFLHIQRPRTPLLDNLRYAPASENAK